MRINEHREKPQGLADLLLADAMVDDGILLQHDGSLMAAWSYAGPDLESAEPDHLNALSVRLSRVLNLGAGWMIHCDVIRSEAPGYPESAFPDPISALIDDERRVQFTAPGGQFRSRYYIAITYLPPKAKQERVASWVAGTATGNLDIASQQLARFKRTLESVENVISQISAVRLRTVKTVDRFGYVTVHDELLRYIHYALTGKDHPVVLPTVPVGLNDLLASEDFGGGLEPMIGQKHIRVVSIDGYPEASRPGILSALDQLPFEYRWSTRAILMDPYQAKQMFGKDWKIWGAAVTGFMSKIMGSKNPRLDSDAIRMQADVDEAISEASSQEVYFCFYSSVVVIMDTDKARLAESVRTVQATLQNLGFSARDEKVNAVEAWRGSIPGDGYANVRRVRLHTLNLADMLPLTSVWGGLEVNPSPLMPPDSPPLCKAVTTGATPFNVHLHVRDLGHSLLIGPGGSGKSTALGLTIAQWFRYPDAQVFCFDWDYSVWLLTHALGGRHYDLLGNDDLAFCPLRMLDSTADVAWAAQWAEDLCRLSGMVVLPKHRNEIVAGVQRLARGKRRTLTDFLTAVQDEEVREAIRHYTLQGTAGLLLDAEKDSLTFGSGCRMVAFECKSLMECKDAKLLLPVLLYLFRRIEQRLDGSPTLIVLDEAWAYLAHEMFREKLEMWIRTLRRRNAAIVMATQQPSDIASSPIADTILDQNATTIFLANPVASKDHDAYRRFGLNEKEISMLQYAQPKRDYYLVSALGRRMVDFAMGPVALSFVSVNSPPERARAAAMMQANPEGWQGDWLRARGLPDWADYLTELKGEMVLCASA